MSDGAGAESGLGRCGSPGNEWSSRTSQWVAPSSERCSWSGPLASDQPLIKRSKRAGGEMAKIAVTKCAMLAGALPLQTDNTAFEEESALS